MDVDEQDTIVKELQVYLFEQVYNIGIGAYYHYMYNWPWVKNSTVKLHRHTSMLVSCMPPCISTRT